MNYSLSLKYVPTIQVQLLELVKQAGCLHKWTALGRSIHLFNNQQALTKGEVMHPNLSP